MAAVHPNKQKKIHGSTPEDCNMLHKPQIPLIPFLIAVK
jgi:hypothetical protein